MNVANNNNHGTTHKNVSPGVMMSRIAPTAEPTTLTPAMAQVDSTPSRFMSWRNPHALLA